MADTKATNPSPARSAAELTKALGGMPPQKDVKAIDAQNTPPATPTKGEGGSQSVRV